MNTAYFMGRLERGLREYFKGNPVVGIEREQIEGGDAIVFKATDVAGKLAWTELKLYCRIAGNGKVTVAAIPPRPAGISHYNWPKLNSCTFSLETSVSDKAIANRVMREIVDPAREPMAQYLELIERQKAEESALPGIIAKYRMMGFSVHQPREASATSANFYLSKSEQGLSVSGTLYANGRVNIDRAYLDAEKGEALMKFLQEIA